MNSFVQAENDKHISSNKKATTSYTTEYTKYVYATIHIPQKKLVPTKEFVKEVEAAIQTPNKPKDALKHIFDKYGHVVRTELELGASEVRISSTEMSQAVRL